VDGSYHPAVVNVGRHPTLPEGNVTVEAHVLTEDALDLYGQHVRLSFMRFQRAEICFDSKDELQAQIARDVEDARAYFAKTLIGDNFDKVDDVIRSLYNSDDVKNVRSYNDPYTKKCVELLLREGKITKDKNKAPDVIIPKLKSSLKHKLTYNPLIYKLGLIFLGKDTKLRRLLKKHI
jgi:hypothetical protein